MCGQPPNQPSCTLLRQQSISGPLAVRPAQTDSVMEAKRDGQLVAMVELQRWIAATHAMESAVIGVDTNPGNGVCQRIGITQVEQSLFRFDVAVTDPSRAHA